MSDTPRTDAFTTSIYNESCAAAADVPGCSGRDIPPEEAYGMAVDFAKGLEREVAALREALAEISKMRGCTVRSFEEIRDGWKDACIIAFGQAADVADAAIGTEGHAQGGV